METITYALEGAVAKGQAVAAGLHRRQAAVPPALLKHGQRQVADHHLGHISLEAGRDPAGAAADIQQGAGAGQGEEPGELRRIRRRHEALVESGQKIEMKVDGHGGRPGAPIRRVHPAASPAQQRRPRPEWQVTIF